MFDVTILQMVQFYNKYAQFHKSPNFPNKREKKVKFCQKFVILYQHKTLQCWAHTLALQLHFDTKQEVK